MAKFIGDVVASVGEYERDGVKKKEYKKCGAAFENEKGQISFKLDTVPVAPGWSGWFSVFEPRADDAPKQGGDVPF